MTFCLVSVPALASAQTPGGRGAQLSPAALLPGVAGRTVEGPALIAKVRATVTDDSGQYRIPDSPRAPTGSPSALTGFTTVVREGVELTGGGVMTIRRRRGAGLSPRQSR